MSLYRRMTVTDIRKLPVSAKRLVIVTGTISKVTEAMDFAGKRTVLKLQVGLFYVQDPNTYIA